jgi:hypothetical protein
MGERKVINKYFGPTFDPEKIPRKKRLKNDQMVVRMMLPMSVRCKQCGEYMYKGKKFNSRREDAHGEEYLGIKIIRFYMNCTNCRAEFCIKTDPKNEDYVAEAGVQRNYEPWRDREAEIEGAYTARAEEDEGDAMKRLENRTRDSKLEMDNLDTLDELRTMNARNNAASLDELIARKRDVDDVPDEPPAEQTLPAFDEDDEAVIDGLFGPRGKRMRRMDESDDENGAVLLPPVTSQAVSGAAGSSAALPRLAEIPRPQPAKLLPVRPAIRVQPKGAHAAVAAGRAPSTALMGASSTQPAIPLQSQAPLPVPASVGLPGMGGYGSGSSDADASD